MSAKRTGLGETHQHSTPIGKLNGSFSKCNFDFEYEKFLNLRVQEKNILFDTNHRFDDSSNGLVFLKTGSFLFQSEILIE